MAEQDIVDGLARVAIVGEEENKVYTVRSGPDRILFGTPQAVEAEIERLTQAAERGGGRAFPDAKELETIYAEREQFRSRPVNPLLANNWDGRDASDVADQFINSPFVTNEEFQLSAFCNDKAFEISQCVVQKKPAYPYEEYTMRIQRGAQVGFAISQRNGSKIITAIEFQATRELTYNLSEDAAAGPMVNQDGLPIKKVTSPLLGREGYFITQPQPIQEATIVVYAYQSRFPCPRYFFNQSADQAPSPPPPPPPPRSYPKWMPPPVQFETPLKQWVVKLFFEARD